MKSVQIKYCGNKTFEDFQVTVESGANYLGVIFAESKRKVEPANVSEWLTKVELHPKKLVGLFVNAPVSEIVQIALQIPLSIIQCHGTESRETLLLIKRLTKKPVWKAIHHDDHSLGKMRELAGAADGYVIDSKVKGLWGGTGKSFDWSFIPNYVGEGKKQGVPVFIAGGVNESNLVELLKYDISGIDLSSGIERNGVKNNEIIKKIEEQVKRHEASTR